MDNILDKYDAEILLKNIQNEDIDLEIEMKRMKRENYM